MSHFLPNCGDMGREQAKVGQTKQKREFTMKKEQAKKVTDLYMIRNEHKRSVIIFCQTMPNEIGSSTVVMPNMASSRKDVVKLVMAVSGVVEFDCVSIEDLLIGDNIKTQTPMRTIKKLPCDVCMHHGREVDGGLNCPGLDDKKVGELDLTCGTFELADILIDGDEVEKRKKEPTSTTSAPW